MKPGFRLTLIFLLAGLAILLTGCLFSSSTIAVRHYLLAPISTNEPPPATNEQLALGINPVKMPSYLLKNSLPVRNGAYEIEYLEGAMWGERLDQCFQRTLAANLGRLLSTDHVYASALGGNSARLRLSISVQQFDVDLQGHGVLIAHWRITTPDSDLALKSGTVRLERTGASPRGHPEAIAMTMSELAAEFSRDLAQAIRESANLPSYGPSRIR